MPSGGKRSLKQGQQERRSRCSSHKYLLDVGTDACPETVVRGSHPWPLIGVDTHHRAWIRNTEHPEQSSP